MNSFNSRRFAMLACALLAVTVSMTACSKKAEPQISHSTLEDARAQSRANAEFNAIAYRTENPRMTGLKIVGHGDAYQTDECPQGSGWAGLSIMNVDKAAGTEEKYKVVCSTSSATLGCYLEKDFEKLPYAKTQNSCDPKLPFPIVKIAK